MRDADEACDQNVEIYIAGTTGICNDVDGPVLLVFMDPDVGIF